MSISSSIKNLTRAQKWRSARSPHQFIETRNPKTSRTFHIPSSPPKRSFSTSSKESSSITKTGYIGWYLRKLESRPMATKTITTSLIYATADLTAQMISSTSGSFDLIRTLRMAGFGLLFLGPSQHLWFNFMSKILPKRDIVATFKKMFMGQALYGPTNYILFFSYNASLQGESGDEILGRLKRDLLPTLRSGLLFWPMCDFVTFRFVPVHLQVHSSTDLLFCFIEYEKIAEPKILPVRCIDFIGSFMIFLLAATGKQYLCIFLDNLLNIHGKLRKSEH